MLQDIDHGVTLVLDRYIYSGAAFSIIKGLDASWCHACDFGLPAPDLVLFLDLEEEVAAQRGGYGEERYEKAETQRRVRSAFAQMAAQGGALWKTLDAATTIDDLAKTIQQVVKQHFDGRELGPLSVVD
jgi:dTMP kinase